MKGKLSSALGTMLALTGVALMLYSDSGLRLVPLLVLFAGISIAMRHR